jgi:hypothetical protein
MFVIDDDLTIHITRGDAAVFKVGAKADNATYIFKSGDVVRFKVFAKKNCEDVVLQKDVEATDDETEVEIALNDEDTTIGEVISKPTDYWYEVELNPDTCPQTLIGYDDDGAKVFKLYPEGGAVNE